MTQVINIEPRRNVLDEPLESCSQNPMTGYFRDGFCNTCKEDTGSHTVCIEVSDSFLEFSKEAGNDLSTPHPEWDFPGLKDGDKWCLCATRWLEAHNNDMAPRIYLKSTHKKALEIIPMKMLMEFAADLN